jgi:pyridoxamine 5'-phosphate oxidase
MNTKPRLIEQEMEGNPFIQFRKWYQEREKSGVTVPNTVSLGTASSDGAVSVRTVLLKGYDESGYVFFSNYGSKKGRQLGNNPKAALLFYWPESARQIRIEGSVELIPGKDSDKYFMTRPEESRLSAWASEQSGIIPDRKYLEKRMEYYKDIFREKPIERPAHWGGYKIVPSWFEFWQEGEHRLHDRICYTLSGKKWIISRLAP